jgi:hypothetical protein
MLPEVRPVLFLGQCSACFFRGFAEAFFPGVAPQLQFIVFPS